jgi:hypothetical protein
MDRDSMRRGADGRSLSAQCTAGLYARRRRRPGDRAFPGRRHSGVVMASGQHPNAEHSALYALGQSSISSGSVMATESERLTVER